MIHLDFVTILYVGAIGLVVIGTLGLVICNHFFRILLALGLAGAGVNLLLVLAGYRGNAVAPILGFAPEGAPMVDPIPQVLVLTAIVIGVGVQTLAVALLVKVYRTYGTLDIRDLKRYFELEIAAEQGIEPPEGIERQSLNRPPPPFQSRSPESRS
jgi:multisubunit Na+/H+ antiporter MnhC subunit